MSRKEAETPAETPAHQEMLGVSADQPDVAPGEDRQDKTNLVSARRYKGGVGQTSGQ